MENGRKYINFRKVLGELSLIFDARSVANYVDETLKEANCLLCYAYIDNTAGLTYEVLAAAHYYDESYYFVGEHKGLGFKIRAESITEDLVLPIENSALRHKYENVIEDIDTHYACGKDIMHIRRFRRLDKFRHPNYPDDMLVALYSEKYEKFEGVWVKVNKQIETNASDEDVFAGTLLNEPNRDYGVHAGQEIRFVYHKIDEDRVLLYMPGYNELLK